MAISGNIIIRTGNVGPTHSTATADFMQKTKSKICRICSLRPETYDEMHYDMAEEWFIYHQYLEYTAKVFMVSKTYHQWWNQQVTQVEDEFIQRHSLKERSLSQFRAILDCEIITMDRFPSSELRMVMHNEGVAILKSNPELWKIRIYRNNSDIKR